MERCETCRKWYGEPRQPKVGDMVNFTVQSGSGNRQRISSRTGKLMLIKDDGYSVIYRKTVYHADHVSHPADPNPLTLAFGGMCECIEGPIHE